MEMTRTVSNPTGTPPEGMQKVIDLGEADGLPLLAMIWIELKPERVQEALAALAAAGVDVATLSLALAIHQPQTVTFGFSGSGLSITFNNGSNDGSNNGNGGAAPAA
ncbi:MAG TPA: hypothetical protein VGP73_11195 [Thermoanaerobaculia bacterium]